MQRLTAEINYWDTRHTELLDQEAAGRTLKIRPETAFRRARVLEGRLEKRRNELTADERLSVRPPIVGGAALVIPRGLLERLRGERDQPASTYTRETRFVERRAMEAVMAAERALGRTPREAPHNNHSYNVQSLAPDGSVIRIEVRGRVEGTPDVTITHNEVLTAKNLGDDYRLALVEVSEAGPYSDRLRYLIRPFDAIGPNDFRITKLVLDWGKLWSRGGAPS